MIATRIPRDPSAPDLGVARPVVVALGYIVSRIAASLTPETWVGICALEEVTPT